MKLINLHLNSTFSFLQSTIEIEKLIDILKKENREYFSITERGNFYSLPLVLKKIENSNLKAIFGLDLDVLINNQIYRFLVYAKNKEAFLELKKLSSFYLKNNEQIELNKLNEFKDLIFIEHPIFGYYKNTKVLLNNLQNHYVSFQSIDLDNEFINKNYSKTLIINHNAIIDFDDNEIILTLNKMRDQKTEAIFESFYDNINFENNEQKELIEKTNDFAKSLYFSIDKNHYILPKYPNEKNLPSDIYLKELLTSQVQRMFNTKTWNDEYKNRLLYEFDIIKKLKFEDYFLIIYDWVKYAKENNISIGPGRGSAAGSLICYLLNITEVDPLKFNLIFERFLNPLRITMPDIDIDVQDDKREEIIQYLVNKYGYENVSNIVTFSSLGKKSAIRDVLRVNEVSPTQINNISKLISDKYESLEEEFEKNSKFALELAKIDNNDEQKVKRILNHASRISGFYRQTGTHAAGVVISNQSLINLIPIQQVDSIQQSQISMEYLEGFGLIKMDVLGLKTLTTIKEILSSIKKFKNIDIDLSKIDLEDKKAFEILSKGNTAGIFQVESPIMINALKKIGVNKFEDIVAIISINRPGPAINIPIYAKRKQGLEVTPKVDKEYDKIVSSTYGIIIYQEQIMEIVQKVANMSFSEADSLRRIISKKKHEEMKQQKEIFISKAINNNYKKEVAENIFNNIERFAEYGFNKSHAVSYSLLTYYMAYLKAHYPLEFYAACISSAHGAQETIIKYANEAKRMNLLVKSPNINYSEINATIINNAIILPLIMIKGIGPEIVKNIVLNRIEFKGYKNFADFLLKTSLIKAFGTSAIETLIKANALRDFKLSQNTMLNEINKDNSDLMLFVKFNKDNINNIETQTYINNYQPYKIINDIQEELQKNELNLLGTNFDFSISNIEPLNTITFDEMHIGNQYITLAYLNNLKTGVAKNGRPYLKLELQNSNNKITGYIFNSADESLKNYVKKVLELVVNKKDENTVYIKSWKVK
ncbi:DNA polymerase III subunit alpha [Mycoplasma struthionis]|uniref:DNA-directed DNA polymerase n=1 Tax=Mycoplasma struthionis TaxID=538220 RepID=A0A502M9F5_9MOLU|nr:DNA polymerase III subunit alpha [Mycoplasma struthionis]TPI02401.1 DNA polymerase III subunit alpha [Mycoplasma struthionis]